MGSPYFLSPLRYPGGKRKLANFMSLIFKMNGVMDGEYAEVYAGGAAVALSLLYGDYARRIHINDLDRSVYAFWVAARDHATGLCRRIERARLTMREWEKQRAIQFEANPDPVDLAYSTFYLNRTNRSGIILGGVIGGKDQAGTWKMDARFNRSDLIRRIERVARWASRIELYRLDGAEFLRTVVPVLPAKSIVYLDPPYYVKGKELLYASYYRDGDHALLAKMVKRLRCRWIVSYDDAKQIRQLYEGYRSTRYGIAYSAQARYRGREVMFFADRLSVPAVTNPTTVSTSDTGMEPHARTG